MYDMRKNIIALVHKSNTSKFFGKFTMIFTLYFLLCATCDVVRPGRQRSQEHSYEGRVGSCALVCGEGRRGMEAGQRGACAAEGEEGIHRYAYRDTAE